MLLQRLCQYRCQSVDLSRDLRLCELDENYTIECTVNMEVFVWW